MIDTVEPAIPLVLTRGGDRDTIARRYPFLRFRGTVVTPVTA